MVTSLIRPSYHQNFARSASESKRPHLWRSKIGHWSPTLGITGITTLRDVSSYRNHGTMNGSMTLDDWVIDAHGYFLDYEGTDDFIDIGDISLFSFGANTDFTMLAWVKTTSISTIQYIMTKFNAGTTLGFRIYFTGSKFRFVIDDNIVSSVVINSNNTLNSNQLYHVGVTADRTGNAQLYIDGVADNNGDISAIGNINNNDSFQLAVGGGGTQFPFKGRIGDCRIWNRVLKSNEIRELFINPSADLELRRPIIAKAPAAVTGRIMSSLANAGGLAGVGGIAGQGGGLAG